jgi:hypothetical protein
MKVSKEQIDILVKILDVDGKNFIYFKTVVLFKKESSLMCSIMFSKIYSLTLKSKVENRPSQKCFTKITTKQKKKLKEFGIFFKSE